MPNVQDVLNSQKQLEELLHSKMSHFENQLQSNDKPNLERLSQEFSEFKSFVGSVLKLIHSQIYSLSTQVDEIDNHNRRNALLFTGVPEKDNENCPALVLDIVQSNLGMSAVRASSIYLCHRLGAKSETRIRPILVRFSDINLRNAIWSDKKKLKSSSFVLCEFLTKARQEVFTAARKHFGLTNCWSSNGAVYVKLPDNSRKRIASAQDLKDIVTKFPMVATASIVPAAAKARPKASPKPALAGAGSGLTPSTSTADPPQTRTAVAARNKKTK